MGWYDHIKKYVWDDNTTPYFVSVNKLTRPQAQKELFAYTLFLVILFGILALAALAGTANQEAHPSVGMGLIGVQREHQSFPVAFYAFTVFCAAIWLGTTKHPHAAIYCGIAPVATLLYILADGLRPGLSARDKVFFIVFTVLWAWYALRVVAIARAYADMPEQGPPG
jgi:hypothetical protein